MVEKYVPWIKSKQKNTQEYIPWIKQKSTVSSSYVPYYRKKSARLEIGGPGYGPPGGGYVKPRIEGIVDHYSPIGSKGFVGDMRVYYRLPDPSFGHPPEEREFLLLIHGKTGEELGMKGAATLINDTLWRDLANEYNVILVAPLCGYIFPNQTNMNISDWPTVDMPQTPQVAFPDYYLGAKLSKPPASYEEELVYFSSFKNDGFPANYINPEEYKDSNGSVIYRYVSGFQYLLNPSNFYRADQEIIQLMNAFFDIFPNNHVPGRRRRFSLFGHSGGGQFANRFLMVHPERLKRVAISGSGSFMLPPIHELNQLSADSSKAGLPIIFDVRRSFTPNFPMGTRCSLEDIPEMQALEHVFPESMFYSIMEDPQNAATVTDHVGWNDMPCKGLVRYFEKQNITNIPAR